MCSEEIILEIEGTPVRCKREELIRNSDYFKAMLEGNFIERKQTNIKLEGVDLNAMNIILALLWDDSYLVENEDILLVLPTACMLQFIGIKNKFQERITETLSPKNCIKIWRATEQLSIKPLYLKAKCMALDEFLQIKDTDCVMEFSLEEIYYYLGNINLKTDSELTVFQTAMKWWYENNNSYNERPNENLLQLLSCVDFQSLLDVYFQEIMMYPEIANNFELKQVISCLSNIKNGFSIKEFSELAQEKAQLLFASRHRVSSKVPCILANLVHSENKTTEENVSFYYDKYKRKRAYEILEFNKNGNLTAIYYDYRLKQFKKFFVIDEQKCQSLDGFKLAGYKEFVFMYGGEFLIGKGNWNYNFWVYDTIRERWERKSVLPFPRRHFETCLVDKNLYIIGGTGVFRVIQENMFWYSYKDDKWSGQIVLPCPGRQLKCCNFSGKLFLLNINNRCGYYFDENNSLWNEMSIVISDDLVANQLEYSVFSYKHRLFMKGRNLIELEVKDKKLVVLSVKELTNRVCDKMEVVLCSNIVYTFYKYRSKDTDSYSLEMYDLETGDLEYVFQCLPFDAVIEIDGDQYTVSSSCKLFSFQHHDLVKENELVNDCFK